MPDIIIVYEKIWTEERGVHYSVTVYFDLGYGRYWQFIDLETIGM